MAFLEPINYQSKLHHENSTQKMMFCPFSFFSTAKDKQEFWVEGLN